MSLRQQVREGRVSVDRALWIVAQWEQRGDLRSKTLKPWLLHRKRRKGRESRGSKKAS